MDIRSIAVFTDADERSLHTRTADEAIRLTAAAGYLDIGNIVAAALSSDADAVHPGYGFLSENPALAESCRDAGIVFIGPTPEAIRAMGDKINAKNLVSSAGVPVVPGFSDRHIDDAGLAEAALRVGLPVLIKPSAGGGGKGMRRVDTADQLEEAIRAAHREALVAFGDATLLVERFVTEPRHIEIQVLADGQGAVVALGERECSLQRRHQKIVEESPSPLLDEATRSAMQDAAVAVANACDYTGAGTVEFIVSGSAPDRFFFMEMNTRLQVEHTVTEMVRGIDLVEWQVRVAAGEPLPWTEPPPPQGHAVQARVYAEDPTSGFLPATGVVRALQEPAGEGIRVDSGLCEGTRVGVDYDPMLAKVIAWAPDRAAALSRLDAALGRTAIVGVRTNIGFLRRLLARSEVAGGNLDTGLVDRVLQDLIDRDHPGRVAAICALIHQAAEQSVSDPSDPWRLLDGFRVSGPAIRRSRWTVAGHEVEVCVAGAAARGATVDWEGSEPVKAQVSLGSGRRPDVAVVELDGVAQPYVWASEGDTIWISSEGEGWELTRVGTNIGEAAARFAGAGPVVSPMPGRVLAVHVGEGASVRQGDPLVTVEAMKMEHVVAAPVDGTVTDVFVWQGESVALGQPLADIAGEGEP
jgi:acetyl-CoA/propionyl-CoA carboxylase biotin carboxyl carrier protein